MTRRLMLIAAALLVAGVVGGLLLYSSLDAVVKAAIERVGSDVTGTRVRVSDVDISPARGIGRLSGFRVTNPEGFERDDAFQFDEILLKIDLASLARDPVIVEELIVERPRIRYEFGDAGTNVGTIQGNAERYSADSEPAAGPKLVIKHLYFRDGEVTVAGARLLKQGLSVPLPDVHMTDVGAGPAGATPAAVTREIVRGLGRRVVTAVAALDLGDKARDAGRAVATGAERTGDAAKRAGQKVKGLFGKETD